MRKVFMCHLRRTSRGPTPCASGAQSVSVVTRIFGRYTSQRHRWPQALIHLMLRPDRLARRACFSWRCGGVLLLCHHAFLWRSAAYMQCIHISAGLLQCAPAPIDPDAIPTGAQHQCNGTGRIPRCFAIPTYPFPCQVPCSLHSPCKAGKTTVLLPEQH